MKLQFALAPLLLASCNAFAAYTVTISQAGNNVVASGSGTFNLSDISPPSATSSFNAEIDGSFAYLGVGAAGITDVYVGIHGPASFGPGATFIADGFTGSITGLLGGAGFLFVPTGYISGTPGRILHHGVS